MGSGQKQTVNLNNAAPTITLTAPPGVGNFLIRFVNTLGSAVTVTFSPVPKWGGGTALTITPTSGAVDIAGLYWNGTNYYGTFTNNFA